MTTTGITLRVAAALIVALLACLFLLQARARLKGRHPGGALAARRRLRPPWLARPAWLGLQTGIAIGIWHFELRQFVGAGTAREYFTVAGLVLTMSLFAFMDHVPGLVATTGIALAAPIVALAVSTGQPELAVMAAALGGGCLAVGWYTARQANVDSLGTGAARFVGLAAGVCVIRAGLVFGPGWGSLAAVAILAVPLTDFLVTAISRWVGGRPMMGPTKDHVVHRLIHVGLSPRSALIAYGAAALISAGAVAAAHRLGHLPILAVAAGVPLIGACLLGVRVASSRPYWLRRILLAGIGLFGLGIVAAIPPALAAASKLDAVRAAFASGAASTRGLALGKADHSFISAGQLATSAEQDLRNPMTDLARLLPVLGTNLRAAQTIAAGAVQMSEAARQVVAAAAGLSGSVGDTRIAIQGGELQPAQWQESQEGLTRAIGLAQSAVARVGASGGFLIPKIASARNEFLQKGRQAAQALGNGRDAMTLVPIIFGADAPHTWFLAIENPVELRGTGGFLGAFGILQARDGRLQLTRFESDRGLPAVLHPPPGTAQFDARYDRFYSRTVWANVNMTPDFPSAASMMAGMWQSATGVAVDGVIAIDATAFNDFLPALGPITVGQGQVISAANFLPLALNEAYIQFPVDQARVDYLLEVGRQVWSRLVTGQFSNIGALAGPLGAAIRGKHVQVWIPGKDPLVKRLGLSGALTPPGPGTDYLLVVGNNAAANKVDYYAQRSIDYTVEIGSSAQTQATVGVRLDNPTPDSVTAMAVVGPALSTDPAALNRSYLSVFLPPTSAVLGASVDGSPVGFESENEGGLSVASYYLQVPRGSSSRLQLITQSRSGLSGEYRLVVQHQPTLRPDAFRLTVILPLGKTVLAPLPFGSRIDGRVFSWSGVLDSDREFVVRYK